MITQLTNLEILLGEMRHHGAVSVTVTDAMRATELQIYYSGHYAREACPRCAQPDKVQIQGDYELARHLDQMLKKPTHLVFHVHADWSDLLPEPKKEEK
jgi:hypothetical protein